jgi:hypothetical protein
VITNVVIVTLALLVQVESQGYNNKKGDGGRAVGLFQMHPCMVDEVNRLSHTHYKYSDRSDPWKSHAMATLWLTWASKHYHISSPIDLAYRWNHPASGKARKSYRVKVKQALSHLADVLADVPVE